MPGKPGDPVEPADELVRTAYAREASDTAILHKGMSLADVAHVVELIECEKVHVMGLTSQQTVVLNGGTPQPWSTPGLKLHLPL